MAYTHLSRTRPIAVEWDGLSGEDNAAKTMAIYEIVAANGGDMKVVGISPSAWNLVSVIEYPDEASAKRAIAAIVALGTLEFESAEALWDVAEWRAMVLAASST